MTATYVGSGPYCYSNSLAMMMGDASPSPAVIEVLTGSPFGFQFLGGFLPLFDPYGWDPTAGVDAAMDALGWTCVHESGGDDAEALARLVTALKDGPVMAGPLEMGLLSHQPGSGRAIGADHFVIVLEATEEYVRMHDPQGYPFAVMPTQAFMSAWCADQVNYAEAPFEMRHGFSRTQEIQAADALDASIPAAKGWSIGRDDLPVPPGTIGGAEGIEALAQKFDDDPGPMIPAVMANFGIRLGSRRLHDASVCLRHIGREDAALILEMQSASLGALQYPVVVGNHATVAEGLRRLAPMYRQMADVLSQ